MAGRRTLVPLTRSQIVALLDAVAYRDAADEGEQLDRAEASRARARAAAKDELGRALRPLQPGRTGLG